VIDKEANDYIDQFIANSEVVQSRIRRYYDQDAEVIYPPVSGNWRNEGNDGYFVTWSRLDPKKRMDLVIEAFGQLDEHLIVAGTGPKESQLKQLAAKYENVEMRGYVDDIESLVATATAVVYAPIEEDFGIVGAEALCAGKPLIGVNEGFTQHQVTPETGVTFSPTVESLIAAIESFDAEEYDSKTIQKIAQRYEFDQFEDQIKHTVYEVIE